MDQNNYIQVRQSQLNYYTEVPLFYQTDTNSYLLYKPAGASLPNTRISQQRYPRLYIQEKDRIVAFKELQKGFNKQIEQSIATGDVVAVKAALCNLVEETLAEPRSGTLKALPETVDTLINGYSKQPETLKFLKDDVQAGKFNRDIFEKFCYSLI